ncbi:nitric oxide synthase oxygenase, partial [Streptomyces sp. NPDC054933]
MKASRLCVHPSTPSSPLAGPVAVEAEDLVRQLAAEGHLSADATEQRVREIRDELAATGTYRHSAQELCLGARIAWRNNPQCIGKFYWKGLETRDCRDVGADLG